MYQISSREQASLEVREEGRAVAIDMLLIVHEETRKSFTTKKSRTDLSYQAPGSHLTVEIHSKNTTPQLLNKLFSSKGLQVNGHNQVQHQPSIQDFHVYPWDKSNLKSMALDLKQFQKLDAFASQVNVKGNVRQLVKVLMREAHTDLEKVRAIWIWICHHIEYDTVGYHNHAQQETETNDILQSRRGICAGYSGLFEQMCSIINIQCMNIAGYAKGCSYRTGDSFAGNTNHSWNAVYLEGGWHLLDCTWGAGFADDTCSSFSFEYNEFYFLTHPALFIEDHFPENQNWQLLKPPLTLQQFQNNIRCKTTFYNLGLLTSYPKSVVAKTVNGKATICIKSCTPILFSFTLNATEKLGLMTFKKNEMKLEIYPQVTGHHRLQLYAKPYNSAKDRHENVLDYIIECTSVDRNIKIPIDLDNPVGPSWLTEKKGFLQPSQSEPIIYSNDGRCSVGFMLEKDVRLIAILHSDDALMTEVTKRRHILQIQQGKWIEFKIHLPQMGNYVLKIYSESKSTPGYFDYVCNYLIFCTNTEVRWPAFPEELQNPVGPCWLTQQKGFLQPSHLDPIIYTLDGLCSLSFKVDEGINVLATLHSDEVTTEQIERRHILLIQKKKQIELKIQLPQAGAYALKIYHDYQNAPSNFKYIGNYLLSCLNAAVKWPPFPSKLQNPVGPSWLSEKKGFLKPTHLNPIIHTTDGRCSLSFTLATERNVMATLYSDDIPMTEALQRRHILQVHRENWIEFRIQLPQSGTYVFTIYADNKFDPGNFEYVCNYLLTCSNINVKWPSFSPKLQNPVGPNWLTLQNGFLHPSHPEPIIDSPDGCCTVSFTLEKDRHVFARLQSDIIPMTEQTERRHILQVQQKNRVEFSIQLPQAGTYTLGIYAESESDPDSFIFICNYVIVCTNTEIHWPPFPEDLHNPVGPNWLTEKKGFLHPSHLEPIIYTSNGYCAINFTLADNMSTLATLHFNDITMSEEMKRRHVFKVQKGNRVEFKIQLPQAGLYVLKICAKSKSNPGRMYSYICNYLISCTNANLKWPAFPLKYARWAENYDLVEPLAGVLPANSNIRFKLKAHGVAAVSVRGVKNCPLSLSKDGFWEGMYNTTGCQYVNVNVTDNLNQSYSSILNYCVE
ncbi:kyphoscoliosis peptidase-like isoform X2 [Rhinatrema bivittatum]|uniref:kyphoscoliosis peptidase-like isoform X2 n=1 Tax=Rhinatrema bivittatum TaxID=194408 RepID=UPI0011269486|nr:kyphoscoliosis peptidase-like isoform X2 [Rhinatrema bivittatum]